jgi:HEPN domain-containing protein
MAHPNGAERWLDREDKVCREGRIQRLEWLASLTAPAGNWLFPGGWVAIRLFEEARYSFAYGQFMATTVLGMAYVERTLAALLFAAGRSDLERADISVLFREAVALGWCDEAEFRQLDRARRLRNPLAHFRGFGQEDTVEYRSITQDQTADSIVEEDARHVMRVVFRLLGKNAA